VLRRLLGDKAMKLVFAEGGIGHTTRNIPTRAGLPAQGPGGPVRDGRIIVTAAVSQRPCAASRTPDAPRWARLDHFPPRPQSVSWPATRLDRAGVVSVLAAPPFAVDDPIA
jgi:hypothetical protein